MAYNESLANRIREKLVSFEHVEEKRMMGALTFMLNDKMCVGVLGDEMMCRIDPELRNELVERQGCRTMGFKNRPMQGFVLVDETGMRSQSDFDYWIGLSIDFNARAKSSKKKK